MITLTALRDLLFDSFDICRVLVIAPLRVARDTWRAEAAKWEHLSGLRLSVVVGSEQTRRGALRAPADIYVINRENVEWLTEIRNAPEFDAIVIDELSSFKNHQTKRFHALMRLRPKAKRVIGLTGTPAPNGLMDLFAEFRVLDMGERLGRFITRFRDRYFVPDRRNGQIVFSYKPRPNAEREIYGRISDITISMRALDHLAMPKLVSARCEVELSEPERKRYDAMKNDLVLKLADGEITAGNAASLSNKLSQMASGAIYTDDGSVIRIHDRKLDALEDLIEAANGRPLLVAYWFRHDLTRITERLERLKLTFDTLDGESSIEKWNRGELPVALIHPASAGHGLNLQTGGNTIVWFSVPWSLELYEQTNARLWRQGQTAGTVVAQHIVARDTIDERILDALERKDTTQSALIAAVKADVKGVIE